MIETLDAWMIRQRNNPLPILRQSREYFHIQKNIPSISISRLWQVLAMDPGLCLNILRLAGKSKKTRVISVQHGIRMLGLPRVLGLPDDLPLLEDTAGEDIRHMILAAHARAHHAALQCRNWSELIHDCTVEDLVTAAISTELVIFMLCCYRPRQARQIFQLTARGSKLAAAIEQVTGFSEPHLGECIASAWRLPEPVLMHYRNLHGQDDARKVHLISNAHCLVRELETGWGTETIEQVIGNLAVLTHKPADILTCRIHKTAARAARQSHRCYHPVVPAAVRLNYLPKSCVGNNVVSMSSARTAKEIYKNALVRIRNDAGLDYSGIMTQTFRAACRGLGLSRVFFAVLGKDKQALLIRHIVTAENDSGLKRYRLLLAENPLLQRIMNKPQLLHIHNENAEKYLPLLSLQLRTVLADRNFMMISMFVRDKPVGLFYADCCGNRPLEVAQVKYFKLIVRETAQALAELSNDTEEKYIVNA